MNKSVIIIHFQVTDFRKNILTTAMLRHMASGYKLRYSAVKKYLAFVDFFVIVKVILSYGEFFYTHRMNSKFIH
jgi:hypothetical protein